MSKKRVSLNDRLNKPITNAVSAFTTKIDTKNDLNNNTINETDSVTKYVTNNDTKNDTYNRTDNVTLKNTKHATNNVNNNTTNNDSTNVSNNNTINTTNNITVITQTKSIKVGNTTFKSNYKNNDKLKRLAYTLREDTVEKINKCSKISGIKKAELVDLILNSVLTDVLNKIKWIKYA